MSRQSHDGDDSREHSGQQVLDDILLDPVSLLAILVSGGGALQLCWPSIRHQNTLAAAPSYTAPVSCRLLKRAARRSSAKQKAARPPPITTAAKEDAVAGKQAWFDWAIHRVVYC